MSVECLVVIPARGGSKGVPRKNVAEVAGVPLVARAVRTARAATRITRVVVSTDDAEIARISALYGADVVDRPAQLSGDGVSSESAVLHALTTLREREAYSPALVVLMQCTSPLTSALDLDGLVQTLEREHADSAFLAVRFFHFLWERDAEGTAQPIHHTGKQRKRRQDLAPQYLENGAAYAMRSAAFLASGERFCGKTVVHEVDAQRCLEIDEPLDFVKAEAVARELERTVRAAHLPRPVQCLVMDFDGVLTDDAVHVDQDGTESVRCSRSDGYGLSLLERRGVRLLILSKERNAVVTARANKLKIECIQGVDDKLTMLEAWASSHAVELAHTVYIGNDLNDLACMRRVGCAAAPRDAQPGTLRAAAIVTQAYGGQGAVRELCDLILAGLPALP